MLQLTPQTLINFNLVISLLIFLPFYYLHYIEVYFEWERDIPYEKILFVSIILTHSCKGYSLRTWTTLYSYKAFSYKSIHVFYPDFLIFKILIEDFNPLSANFGYIRHDTVVTSDKVKIMKEFGHFRNEGFVKCNTKSHIKWRQNVKTTSK